MDISELPQFLTPPQVAKILHVKVETVHKWIRRAELRAMNVSDGAIRPRHASHGSQP